MNYDRYYGEGTSAAEVQRRLDGLAKRFRSGGASPEAFYSASGRAEVLGNHTDHQHGKVIVAAISRDILAAVRRRRDDCVEIHSEGFQPIRFSLSDTTMQPKERGKSIALARGVAHALAERGYRVGGFTAYTDSTVFRGAGVSSSAAFEVLVTEIFNDLYLGGCVSPIEKAEIGQYAESVYFGKPCGLLDQSGVAYGGLHLIDFRYPSDPQAERLTPPKGYSFVITNTGGSHAGLTEYYAGIRADMCGIAAEFGKKTLRQVSHAAFVRWIPTLRGKYSERAILRAFHFYDEERRVERAAKALQAGKIARFLDCVNRSGESSLALLQNAYVPGSEEQPIALGLRLSAEWIRDGAVRLHGGGFAGTILAILADREVEEYMGRMRRVFGAENVFAAKIRQVGACRIEGV